MALRTGITTGTCAAAAARAAAMVLCEQPAPTAVEIALPAGQMIDVPVLYARRESSGSAIAAVRKDAGDDPDVTHGLEIVVRLSWAADGDVTFRAGDGVGTVTKPGLQIPPGEPAINPVPRRMIRLAVRQVTDRPVSVEISIPGGRDVAAKTFNPRLGIEGGLSILGTTGIVRPYCTRALRDALRCELDVAAACGASAPVLVPGNIGAAAVRKLFCLRDEQLVEVSNEWGFVLELVRGYPFTRLLIAGHPGKLAKFIAGEWDTHSARSKSAVEPVRSLYRELFGKDAADSPTVEGIFAAMPDTRRLGDPLAARIRTAVEGRTGKPVAVVLVNMQGGIIGIDGDTTSWQ